MAAVASVSDMNELQEFLRENGGYLHPFTRLVEDDEYGVHLQAVEDLEAETHLLTSPHSTSLSCLNAMVDDAYPVFKNNATAFTVEALGFFYLMTQWIDRERSFWKPYLDTLPSPEEGFGTPSFFNDEDLKWLEGTDLHSSFVSRQLVWQKYWRQGVAVLKRHGVDTEPYTW